VAQIRAGATLLFDSDPDAEEAETRLKASALIDALRRPHDTTPQSAAAPRLGAGKKILMVDHEDSFVHTLGGYFRETGAEVITLRAGFLPERLREEAPGLVLLSPGPGRPADFNLSATIEAALAENIAIFGVCLGLQGIVEYFGGTLYQLPYPVHGKPSGINILGGRIFDGLRGSFKAGRYYSLFATRDDLPGDLRITAQTDDGLIMAVEHRDLPVAAVQFHPESLLSLDQDFGRALIANVVTALTPPR
jgi:anthranilate synthase